MPSTTFTIEEFHCAGVPTLAVQLSGPPILLRIDCITVFPSTNGETWGNLPYDTRLAAIHALPADFDALETALVAGNSVKIHIDYDKERNPPARPVRGIRLEISENTLARIASDVSATLEVTKDIREEVGTDLSAVVLELKKTNALLQEHLPRRRSLPPLRGPGVEGEGEGEGDDPGPH